MSVPPLAIGSEIWPGLHKLAEEVAELSCEIARLGAFPDGQRPVTGAIVPDFENELADVLAAIMYVRAHNELDRDRIDARVRAKFERLQRWDYAERAATDRSRSEAAA